MSSRGNAISAYSPPFAKGAQVYAENIADGAVTSAKLGDGVIVSGMVGAVTSAYLSAGAVTFAKMNAAQITGTIVSSGITYAVSHGLGAVPAIVVVGLRTTKAIISGGATIGESKASARTSSVFYLVGEPHGVGYCAYVHI